MPRDNIKDMGQNAIIERVNLALEAGNLASLETIPQWVKYVPKEKVDTVNKDGKTLLHLCAEEGEAIAIQELLKKGADPAIVDKYSCNASFYALIAKNFEGYYLLRLRDDVKEAMLLPREGENESEQSLLRKIAYTKFYLLNPRNTQEKQNVIFHCMNAILYTRWSNTSSYAEYKESIDYLITLYGETVFIAGMKKLFKAHLEKLDLKNIQEHGPHSDISSYGVYMPLFQYILQSKYKLCMENFGVLVNVKTSFGDIDFWKICKEYHTNVYKAFIDVIDAWPKTIKNTHFYHCHYLKHLNEFSPPVDEFSPLEVFASHFNSAYEFIENDLTCKPPIKEAPPTSSLECILREMTIMRENSTSSVSVGSSAASTVNYPLDPTLVMSKQQILDKKLLSAALFECDLNKVIDLLKEGADLTQKHSVVHIRGQHTIIELLGIEAASLQNLRMNVYDGVSSYLDRIVKLDNIRNHLKYLETKARKLVDASSSFFHAQKSITFVEKQIDADNSIKNEKQETSSSRLPPRIHNKKC